MRIHTATILQSSHMRGCPAHEQKTDYQDCISIERDGFLFVCSRCMQEGTSQRSSLSEGLRMVPNVAASNPDAEIAC
jgi:hypothetical protein